MLILRLKIFLNLLYLGDTDAERFFDNNFIKYEKYKIFNIKKVSRSLSSNADNTSTPVTIGMRMKFKKDRIKQLLVRNKKTQSVTINSNNEDSTNTNKDENFSILKESNKDNIDSYSANTHINMNIEHEHESAEQKPKVKGNFVLKNRLAAQLSRDRKKKEFLELKKFSDDVVVENLKLKHDIEKIENEFFIYKINNQSNYCNKCNSKPNNACPKENLNENKIHNSNLNNHEHKIKQLQKKYNQVGTTDISDLTVISRGGPNTNSCFKLGLFTSFLVVICIIGSFFWTSFINFDESLLVNSGVNSVNNSQGRILVNSLDSLENSKISRMNGKSQQKNLDIIKSDFIRNKIGSVSEAQDITKKGFIENMMYSWFKPTVINTKVENVEDGMVLGTGKDDNINMIETVIDRIKTNEKQNKRIREYRNNHFLGIFSSADKSNDAVNNMNVEKNEMLIEKKEMFEKNEKTEIIEQNEKLKINNNETIADEHIKMNNLNIKKKRRNLFFSDTCSDDTEQQSEIVDIGPKKIKETLKPTEVCIKNQKFLWEAHNEEEELQTYLNKKKNKQNNQMDITHITSLKSKKKRNKLGTKNIQNNQTNNIFNQILSSKSNSISSNEE